MVQRQPIAIIYILSSFLYVFYFAHTRITFDTTEDCYEWSRLITTSESSLKRLDDIFAFQYYNSLLVDDALHHDDDEGMGMVVVNGGISALTSSSVSTSLTSASKKITPGVILFFLKTFCVYYKIYYLISCCVYRIYRAHGGTVFNIL